MSRRWTPGEIERALRGDAALVDELFSDLLEPMRAAAAETMRGSWVAARLPTRVDLREALAEVIVHLLDKDGHALRRWDPARGPLIPYVQAIVRNRVKTFLSREFRRGGERGRARDEREEEVAVESVAARSEDVLLAGLELEAMLDRLKTQLSPENYAIARMRFLEGQSAAEIGRVFGLAENAVRTRVRRIRQLARGVR